MQISWRKINMPPKVFVVTPLVVLSVIFAIIIAIALLAENLPENILYSLIFGGIALYSVAIGLLFKIGVASIYNLITIGITDSLSTLPNRRALHPAIQQAQDDKQGVAVALIDLDGFKIINDLYGHAVGDEMIKQCAKILSNVCDGKARPFRLGGDEFAIYLAGPQAKTTLEEICRHLLQQLQKPMAIADRRISVGASIGLSYSDAGEAVPSSEILRQADVAMYASKRGGKMECTWFRPEFDCNLKANHNLDAEMRCALGKGQFQAHYQPLVHAKTQQVVAVEALIRWMRPDNEYIGPDIFIPIAEETGLINPISLFVLKQSCKDALGWNDVPLSVNVSAVQLHNPEFPGQIKQILQETGFPAHRLELEINETCLSLDPLAAKRNMDAIQSFGVKFSLDDFGAGCASIGFLRQFRFEKLKLDRSLIVDAADDISARAMMLSSISMAQALKMTVIAEGVETLAQADLARSAGCDQMQGWLYFRAMPSEQIMQYLAPEMPAATHNPSLPQEPSPLQGIAL